MMEGEHRIAVDGVGHEMGCWWQRGCCVASLVQAVPGHEGVVPVGLGGCGGAGEGLDDDHLPIAAWTRQTGIERLFRHMVIGWWYGRQ